MSGYNGTVKEDLLEGVICKVEVRTEMEDRSKAIGAELRKLGARVENKLVPSLTHVIYRSGTKRTRNWAERHGVFLVTVGWIKACMEFNFRMPERFYRVPPLETQDADGVGLVAVRSRRRQRFMQPRDLDEQLQLSADRSKRAAKKHSKRDALRRQALEADIEIQRLEGERLEEDRGAGVVSYFRDPKIIVPNTPPGMRDFKERLERRKRGEADSDLDSSGFEWDLIPSSSNRTDKTQLCKSPSSVPETPLTHIPAHHDAPTCYQGSLETHKCLPVENSSPSSSSPSTTATHEEPHNSSSIPPYKRKLFREHRATLVDIPHPGTPVRPYKKTTLPRFLRHKHSSADSAESSPSSDQSSDSDSPSGSPIPNNSASGVPKTFSSSTHRRVLFEPTSSTSTGSSVHDLRSLIATPCRESSVTNSHPPGSVDPSRAHPALLFSPPLNGYTTPSSHLTVNCKFRPATPFSTGNRRRRAGRFFLLDDLEPAAPTKKRDVTQSAKQNLVAKNSPALRRPEYDGMTSPTKVLGKPADNNGRLGIFEQLQTSLLDQENRENSKQNSYTPSINPILEDVCSRLPGLAFTLSPEDLIPSQTSSQDPYPLPSVLSSSPPNILSICNEIKPPRALSPPILQKEFSLPPSGHPLQSSPPILSQNIHSQKSIEDISPADSHSLLHLNESESSTIFLNSETSPKIRRDSLDDFIITRKVKKGANIRMKSSRSSKREQGNLAKSLSKKNMTDLSANESANNTPKRGKTVSSKNVRMADFPSRESQKRVKRAVLNESSTRDVKKSTESPRAGVVTMSPPEQRPLPEKFKSIAVTSLHKDQRIAVESALARLGSSTLTESVTVEDTTHMVTSLPIRRTLNLLRALLVPSCCILRVDWVLESADKGYWLPEAQFKISELPPPSNFERLFTEYDDMFVGESVRPPKRDLVDMITMAGGQISKSFRQAGILIEAERSNAISVSASWILDSIMKGEIQPIDSYLWRRKT